MTKRDTAIAFLLFVLIFVVGAGSGLVRAGSHHLAKVDRTAGLLNAAVSRGELGLLGHVTVARCELKNLNVDDGLLELNASRRSTHAGNLLLG